MPASRLISPRIMRRKFSILYCISWKVLLWALKVKTWFQMGPWHKTDHFRIQHGRQPASTKSKRRSGWKIKFSKPLKRWNAGNIYKALPSCGNFILKRRNLSSFPCLLPLYTHLQDILFISTTDRICWKCCVYRWLDLFRYQLDERGK